MFFSEGKYILAEPVHLMYIFPSVSCKVTAAADSKVFFSQGFSQEISRFLLHINDRGTLISRIKAVTPSFDCEKNIYVYISIIHCQLSDFIPLEK